MDSETIESKAADWFARRDSGSWTSADEVQFDEWLACSTAHRIAFIRLEAAWQHSARLKALGAGVAAGVIPPRGSWGDSYYSSGAAIARGACAEPTRRWTQLSRRWIAAAASVVMAVAVGAYLVNSGLFDSDRYSTKVGALETVPLSDGSLVTLNTDSRIHVALAERQRHIELDKGEAFFDVAKDSARPFVVTAGRKRIVAVGTKFSVRRDHDDIVVAVSEGKVRIEDEVAPASGRAAEVLVGAGSFARTDRSDVLIHDHAGPEVDQLLSWRSGYLVFRDITLADAVAEFNRYNTRKIVIQDPAIAGIHIGGNFRTSNTDAFLWLLENGFPVSVDQSGDRVILKAR